MRKNSGDRSLSAAVQHRKASGDFDHARAEKLHAHLRNGRSPVKPLHRQQCAMYDAKKKKAKEVSSGSGGPMSAMSFVSVLVTLTGSLFLVSYAVVSTAIANANIFFNDLVALAVTLLLLLLAPRLDVREREFPRLHLHVCARDARGAREAEQQHARHFVRAQQTLSVEQERHGHSHEAQQQILGREEAERAGRAYRVAQQRRIHAAGFVRERYDLAHRHLKLDQESSIDNRQC